MTGEQPIDDETERQLIGLAKLLDRGVIDGKEYEEHKRMLIGDDRFVPDPDLAAIRAHPKQIPDVLLPESDKTHDEWVVHWLRESAIEARDQTRLIRSIKGWVSFFGIVWVASVVILIIAFVSSS